MGVIARQGIKHSIVTFASIAIGAINLLIIYTYCLTEDELGLMQWLIQTSSMLVPFLVFGANSLSVRFFPTFRTRDNRHHGFLRLLLLLPLIGFAIFFLLALILWPYMMRFLEQQSNYALLIIPISFSLAYTALISEYSINFQRIVIPNILSNFFPKVAVPLLVLLYFFWHQRWDWMLYTYALIYTITMFASFGYLQLLGQLKIPKIDWSFIKPSLQKEMKSFMIYGILGRTSARLAFSLDVFMLGTFLGYSSAGIYSVAAFISNTIDAPKQAINNISLGILAHAYKENDLKEIKTVYYKSCINQFIAAIFLFIGIWASLDYLFDLMSNGEVYRKGKYVVLLLGIARVIDAVTGVNNEVIGQSKFYRFNFYSILVLSLLNILLNLLFVYYFGMIGVAIATLISITVYNIGKYLFILIKMKMQPLDYKIPLVALFGTVCYGFTLIIPDTGFAFLDIGINSLVIGTSFPACIYLSKVSPDMNSYIDFGLSKIGLK